MASIGVNWCSGGRSGSTVKVSLIETEYHEMKRPQTRRLENAGTRRKAEVSNELAGPVEVGNDDNDLRVSYVLCTARAQRNISV